MRGTRHGRGQTLVTNEDVNAGAGARAGYLYRSPTTVVVTAWGNTELGSSLLRRTGADARIVSMVNSDGFE